MVRVFACRWQRSAQESHTENGGDACHGGDAIASVADPFVGHRLELGQGVRNAAGSAASNVSDFVWRPIQGRLHVAAAADVAERLDR